MKVNITKNQLRQLIQEEVKRMTTDEDVVAGSDMAESVINEFSQLSEVQRHAFLTKFISFLTEDNTWFIFFNLL